MATQHEVIDAALRLEATAEEVGLIREGDQIRVYSSNQTWWLTIIERGGSGSNEPDWLADNTVGTTNKEALRYLKNLNRLLNSLTPSGREFMDMQRARRDSTLVQ